MAWIASGVVLFCLVMVILTIDELEPQNWYGNPIDEDEDDDEG